jgi:hypothetical protein
MKDFTSTSVCRKWLEMQTPFNHNAAMNTVQEIESAISKLPKDDFESLAEWFDQKRETGFDRQLAADAKSGRLDALYQRAQAKSAGQPDMPLDEFLRQRRVP